MYRTEVYPDMTAPPPDAAGPPSHAHQRILVAIKQHLDTAFGQQGELLAAMDSRYAAVFLLCFCAATFGGQSILMHMVKCMHMVKHSDAHGQTY